MSAPIISLDDHRGPQLAAPPRELPHNIEAEQSVLGCILLNNAVLHAIGAKLEPTHFYETLHQQIFEVAAKRIRAGEAATPITVRTWLPAGDVVPGTTVQQYLAYIAREATAPINAPSYAQVILDLAARRAVIKAAQETMALAWDAPVDMGAGAIVESAEAALQKIRADTLLPAGTRVTAADAAAELLEHVDRIRAGEASGKGVTTSIPEIDFDTGGMRGGDLWIVAGRVSMGKSVMATCLARAAAKSGAGTLLFPFEIGRRQAIARILSDMAYYARKPLGYGAILKGQMDDEDRWRLDDVWQRLKSMPLVIDDTSGATIAQIAAKIRSERDRMAKQGAKLSVVILDYLKFIKASDRYAGQRHNEIGEITRGLKQLAKDFDICVVLLAQVNRQTEGRDDKRPQLADLKDSGDLESDADVVALLYRDAYYIERSAAYIKGDPEATSKLIDAQNKLEVIVGKNRVGAARAHQVWCDVACSSIAPQAKGGF